MKWGYLLLLLQILDIPFSGIAGSQRGYTARAEQFDLRELRSLSKLCETCSMIISVCPPKYAGELSQQVLQAGFEGIFVDANAISPMRSQEIGKQMSLAGLSMWMVGSSVALPGRKLTFLCLSGLQSEQVAHCFERGPLVPESLRGNRQGLSNEDMPQPRRKE